MEVLTSGMRHKIKPGESVIFLAGPTKRGKKRRKKTSKKFTYWRRDALKILKKLGYDGIVVVPEPFYESTDKQVAWENRWLTRATKIVFWVARYHKKGYHASVTNLEFGRWSALTSKKVVYGRPDDADSIGSSDFYALLDKIPIYTDLEETLIKAIQ